MENHNNDKTRPAENIQELLMCAVGSTEDLLSSLVILRDSKKDVGLSMNLLNNKIYEIDNMRSLFESYQINVR